MKTQSEKLITNLIGICRENRDIAKALQNQAHEELNWKENEKSWSILECLEHLNRYGNYYLPEIENKLKKAKTESEPVFKSGILGNYFAEMMLPKENLRKMKTFRDKDPINSALDSSVITVFIIQQEKLIDLLEKSRTVSLSKEKIATSISRAIKLKLGDTFRFVINHNLRHMKQIENTLLKMKVNRAVPQYASIT